MTQSEWNDITSQQINSLQKQIERLNGMFATQVKINEEQDSINEKVSKHINSSNDIIEGITKLKEPTLKLIKFNSELFKLVDAGLNDYASEISKISQVPVNEIIHRIKVSSGISNPDKGLSWE